MMYIRRKKECYSVRRICGAETLDESCRSMVGIIALFQTSPVKESS